MAGPLHELENIIIVSVPSNFITIKLFFECFLNILQTI
jgi:hypothetical protein